jgi:hypothetical protein
MVLINDTGDKECLPAHLELLRRLRDEPDGGKKMHALWLSRISKYAPGSSAGVPTRGVMQNGRKMETKNG